MNYRLNEKLTGDIDVKMEISIVNFMKGGK